MQTTVEMEKQFKRENEEMTRLLEAETQRFEAEKERNTAMSKELLSTVEEIDSRESRWSAVKSKLGLGFLEVPPVLAPRILSVDDPLLLMGVCLHAHILHTDFFCGHVHLQG